MKVGFVGLGKLGLPCALGVESMGHTVFGVDPSPQTMDILECRKLAYEEVGAQKLLDETKIHLVTYAELVRDAELIFIAVQTPHDPQYEGVTPMPNTRADFNYEYLQSAFTSLCLEMVKQGVERDVVVISTVLPGTMAKYIQPIIDANGLSRKLRLLYNPFFIAMGTALRDFLNPEFVLIGGPCPATTQRLASFYQTIHDRPAFRTTVENAELIKVAYNCYSDDTSVMTSQGWKLFADLSGDEQILSLNPETHYAEWVDHRPVPGQDDHTEMIRFWSKKDDILVTPSHNMFAGLIYNQPGDLPCDTDTYSFRFKLIAAEHLQQRKSFAFTRSVRWLGNLNPTVVVASHVISVEVFARFMGWYLSEGAVSQHSAQSWAVTVSQSRRANTIKYKECQQAVAAFCNAIDTTFSEGPDGFTFYNKQVGVYLAAFGHARVKYVPDLLKESSVPIIRLFLDAYLAGDGCDGRGTGNLRYYATTSDRMASDLGELIVKVGHMPSYRVTNSPLSGRPCHLVYETTSKTSTRRNVERVPYAGKVYCTRLSRNHVMLTRRNGKCAWQGNTYIGMKIVFANTMMEICHKTPNTDCDAVTGALSLATDRLISPRYLKGGMGDGGGCLPAGELVMTEHGPRPIDTIKVGDLVRGCDGELYPVYKVWERGYGGDLASISIGDDTTRLTVDHRMWTVTGGLIREVAAGDIVVGDEIPQPGYGSDVKRRRTVTRVGREPFTGQVFNLWVDSFKHTYTTSIGYVSNCHPRDNIAMSWLAQRLDLSHDFFYDIMSAREDQTEWLADLIQYHAGLLPIALMGSAFKPNTNITTGSPARLLSHYLTDRKIEHKIIEPNQQLSSQPPSLFFVSTQHSAWLQYEFPEGSVVLDPFRYLQDNVSLAKCTYIPIGKHGGAAQ